MPPALLATFAAWTLGLAPARNIPSPDHATTTTDGGTRPGHGEGEGPNGPPTPDGGQSPQSTR